MEVIYGRDKITLLRKPTGVGLGNFDGLHIGHMTLINTLIIESEKKDLTSLIYTFTKHPENILRKENSTPIITTIKKKTELLTNTTLDYLCFDEFDANFSKMEPEEFIKNIIVDELNAKLVVVGFNYRFGHKGKGNPETLKKLGDKYNFRVVVIPSIEVDNEVVSSTLIRKYIIQGDMEKVYRLLGRNYSIKGRVDRGRRVGSQLGFPTANIYPDSSLVLPKFGVYTSRTRIADREYQSVTNVGRAPTFGQHGKVSIETYIFEFDEEIYQEEVEVFFLSKLRKERKFNSVEELIAQINKDILESKKYFLSQDYNTPE